MPTYDYQCNGLLHHRFERFQRFADPPVKECPECGAPVRRLIHATPTIFKGPGFYKTDNAPKASAAVKDDKPADETAPSEDGKPAEKPDAAKPKADAKPAKTEPAVSKSD